MSPLPLLLLLLLQQSWNTEAIDELSDEDIAINASASRSPEVQLNLLQGELRNWGPSLPLDVSFSALADICNTIIDLSIVRPRITPDMSRMNFVLQLDACRNVSVPLTNAEELWTTSGFSPKRPTVIFITGWTSTIDRSNSGPVAKAFACRNDTNFMVLDAANFIRTFYTWSALNTDEIGLYLAKALLKLNRRYVTNNVHLVGHSLGAQIAGAAGRYFKELSGSMLPRVTGLDPANPCFYDGNALNGAGSGDAKYVDLIISNPGVLGTSEDAGDGNFFVEGLVPIKSGCRGLAAITCSHQRAVDYFTESVYPTNERNFRGNHCTTRLSLWGGRTCSNIRTAVMGYAADKKGLFYVDANEEEPYGKNVKLETFTPTDSICGACNPEN
ncbi:phospholipase A1 [Drosophila innubila]|uniref:phospholipase A1 n=1 Tax=Drosophila innubila TaxID=198719 RepID=UPI00148D6EE5|nr:phospholipase A1 [Drosophila innubila]